MGDDSTDPGCILLRVLPNLTSLRASLFFEFIFALTFVEPKHIRSIIKLKENLGVYSVHSLYH